MNANSGRLYDLGLDVAPAICSVLPATGLFRELGRPLSEDELAAIADAAAGDRIVMVEEAVAQKVRLGERELERRKRRREAKR